jgi:general secretion pathway protein M
MKDWFYDLETREQGFVAVGAVCVAVILFWAVVWLPLDRGHDTMRNSVEDWRHALTELRVLAASATTDPAAATSARLAGSDESPVVIVDQTLRERSLNSAVKRRQPTPNGIRVEFENVAFDQLVVWLGDLNSNYGMEVQAGSMSLTNQAGPGRINASLTLERTP